MDIDRLPVENVRLNNPLERRMMMPRAHWVDGSALETDQVTDTLKALSVHLTDEEYARMLDALVPACVDVVLMRPDGCIALAVRLNEPLKGGMSYPGGRMRRGESFGDTAVRHVKVNFGIELDPDRFRIVRTGSWVFSKRAQPPQDNGCHMQGTVVFGCLTAEEAGKIRTVAGDMISMKWMRISEVLGHSDVHREHKMAALQIQAGIFQPDYPEEVE